jgi:DNA-directed RNA polymerase specialized sigma24 family protein
MSAFALYLSCAHPLAAIARRHCIDHAAPLLGGVACGACWERAIRTDERFAVENALPREAPADPDDVDDVAVDLACTGSRIDLTTAEMRAAIQRLHREGLGQKEIAARLHAPTQVVTSELSHRKRATASTKRADEASDGGVAA